MPTKNVAVKLDEGVYAQVAILAQLESTPDQPVSIPDVIRQAVTEHLAGKRHELAERANEVLAEIDRKAAEQRSQIEALFGNGSKPEAPSQGRSQRRSTEATA
jgi:ABC-type glutathione transport system ATPase component